MNSLNIGWIGLGNMGGAMAFNLVNAGFAITVYNRSPEKLLPLTQAGAKTSKSQKKLCELNDIIFTMVSDDEATKSVYSNLLESDVTNKLFVNMTTVSVEMSRTLANLCTSKGASYLEAPVSGNVNLALNGTLTILAGGRQTDYERVLPIFEKLGKAPIYLGDIGCGASAKLAINYFQAITIQGIAEAVSFAEEKGINPTEMMQIINGGPCGSHLSRIKTLNLINHHSPSTFLLKHMSKDIQLACEQGLQTPFSKPIYETFMKTLQQQSGEEDAITVIKTLNP